MTVRSLCARLAFGLVVGAYGITAIAATSESKYGVQGVALISCSIYERERKAASDVYQMMGAWIDGYISGINQQTPGVYSVTSFESTELIAALISEHCSKNPKDAVFGILKLLVDKFATLKLTEPSRKTTVSLGDRQVQMYVETLRRMQSRLAELGFYSGPVSGQYDEQTEQAIGRYQESIEFTSSGFPDQLTLWRLFYDVN